MKNTSLKKIGAIALAAVMAVTFAPVASLTAFAAPSAAQVDKTQTVEISDDINGVEIQKDFTGTIRVNMNGKDATITLKTDVSDASHITLEVRNSKMKDEDHYPTLTLTAANAKLIGHVKISGNMLLSDEPKTLVDANHGYATQGVPSAKVGSVYAVGNLSINKENDGDKDIVAESGAVVIDKLGADDKAHNATIAKDAAPKTTLEATAGKESSLIEVKTKYTFKYTFDGNDGTGSGSYTWTDSKFFNEASTSTNLSQTASLDQPKLEDLDTCALGTATSKNGAALSKLVSYDRAITLYQNTKDKFGAIPSVGYVDKDGLTYFTKKPSKVAASTGVVLLDGSKYVLYDATHTLQSIADNAASSVEFIQTMQYDADDKTEKAADATFNTKKTGLTVKAPEGTNVVTNIEDNFENKDSKKIKNVFVFGTDVTKSYGNVSDNGDADSVTVEQVAKDATLTLTGTSVKAPIKTASGIGYYYVKGLGDEADFVFGATKKITEDFVSKAAGSKTENETVDPAWTEDEEVFASKEISTTVKGVAAGVTIKGEVSQQVLSEDKKAGTKDWLVNDGKNVPQNVYRLRAKVGNNHLFTMDKTEAENAVASGNWVIETSESFKMLPSNTTVEGAVKVLRFRNVKTNEFLFSTDPAEQAAKLADPEWAEGNVAFCGVSAETGYPVTRLFSTIGQGHLYSTAQAEIKDAVEKNFYHKDGVVFFAVETPEKEK